MEQLLTRNFIGINVNLNSRLILLLLYPEIIKIGKTFVNLSFCQEISYNYKN